jgi:lipoate-protein ligase A
VSDDIRTFTLIEHSACDPYLDIALEEALYREFEHTRPGPVLRLWQPASTYVVAGVGRKVFDEVDTSNCQLDDVPVIRRFSGGGTVLHDKGQVCYSFFLPYYMDERLRDINDSWLVVYEYLQKALASFNIELQFHRPCDFACGNRKISGNSSRRGTHGALLHGTILLNSNVWLFSRYLRHPSDEPDYRKGRAHTEFVTTLDALGISISPEEVFELLKSSIGRSVSLKPAHRLVAAARDLVVVKYSRDEWNLRM